MTTSDYISEIEYTHGFYKELCPKILNTSLLCSKLRPPTVDSNFNYLELGSGQGVSLNIIAATNPGNYWGVDLNPSHTINAQSLAAASEANATFFGASFSELLNDHDIPSFDCIALHGIWSWVSEDNRKGLVEIIRKKLRPGGMVYLSYNTTPGWSPMLPVRELMNEYARTNGLGGIRKKTTDSIDFVKKIINSGSKYFAAQKQLVDRLESLTNQNQNYVSHEYFNGQWNPMSFSQVARELDPAQLTFATSASMLDTIDVINLTNEARKMLGQIDDISLTESTRDFFMNQQFRRDVFVKGRRLLSSAEQLTKLNTIRFVLLTQPSDRPMEVQGALGKAKLDSEIYDAVCEELARDNFSPKSIGELLESDTCGSFRVSHLLQALLILTGSGAASPAVDNQESKMYAQSAAQLNGEIWRRAEHEVNMSYSAAPRIGGAVVTSRIEQLFLRALREKQKDVPSFVWRLFKLQGTKLVKDSKALQKDDENVAELNIQFEDFKKKRLPIFKMLGII